MQFENTQELLKSNEISEEAKTTLKEIIERSQVFAPKLETQETKILMSIITKVNTIFYNVVHEKFSKEKVKEQLAIVIALNADLHESMQENIKKD
jgi:hypothetical protein